MEITSVIGRVPFRIQMAGGWIDQPFVNALNPTPPGSMVVVAVEPNVRFMDRCGMATGTRTIAMKLWGESLPKREPAELTRELYEAENRGKPEPSGSQDMVGLIYPGVNRLDYDVTVEGGYFPAHIETNRDPTVARWYEQVVQLVPVAQRPEGYSPLGAKNLDRDWVRRLGQCGKDCFAAIVNRDIARLGESLNENMRCWESLLPHTVRHPTITMDLMGLLKFYQSRYAGAMYSGCGGGYLIVVADEPVPGASRVTVRLG